MLNIYAKWKIATLGGAKYRLKCRCCYNSHISAGKWMMKKLAHISKTLIGHNLVLFRVTWCHFKTMNWTANSILAPKALCGFKI